MESESKLWAIVAYDNIYGGVDKIKQHEIFEGTESEAVARAEELSADVIDCYMNITDAIEELVRSECESCEIKYGTGMPEEEEIREIIKKNDRAYVIYELDEIKIRTAFESSEEMEDVFYLDEEGFLNIYATKEPIIMR